MKFFSVFLWNVFLFEYKLNIDVLFCWWIILHTSDILDILLQLIILI